MAEFTREKRFKTRSVRGTLALAETLAEMLMAPRVILLAGDLGAGKTTLAKGWIEVLGGANADEVTSPTFTLVQEYTGRKNRIFHLDVYRLETEQEVESLGLDELAGANDALLLIEWGEKFASIRDLATAEIRMESLDGDERSFLVRWRD